MSDQDKNPWSQPTSDAKPMTRNELFAILRRAYERCAEVGPPVDVKIVRHTEYLWSLEKMREEETGA